MQYAFNAPDEEMIAWKGAAAEAGLSFAEFLRVLCRNHLGGATVNVTITGSTVPAEVVNPKGPKPKLSIVPVALDRRDVTPRPRPGGKKK